MRIESNSAEDTFALGKQCGQRQQQDKSIAFMEI